MIQVQDSGAMWCGVEAGQYWSYVVGIAQALGIGIASPHRWMCKLQCRGQELSFGEGGNTGREGAQLAPALSRAI